MRLKVEGIINRIMGENTYFFHEEKKSEGILVDPGIDKDAIEKFLDGNNYYPRYILITHAHFDHIFSAPYFKEKYKTDIYASKNDEELMIDSVKNASDSFFHSVVIDNYIKFSDGEILDLLGIKIKCILTPGHTKGSSCFYIDEAKILFSGDTILEHTYGATHFYSGDDNAIKHSILDVLFKLPDDTTIYPGHGEVSSMLFEKTNNAINFV